MSITTARTVPTGGLTGRRSLIAALVVSLALNFCFVAGGVWSRVNAPAPPPSAAQRFRALADELNLTPQQRVSYDKYIAVLRVQSERLREDIDPLLTNAWGEVAKDHPDQARVGQLLDEVTSRRRAYQREVVAQTTALLATFAPEQRAKFLADLRERRGPAQRRRLDTTH